MGSHPYQMRETSFDQARLFSELDTTDGGCIRRIRGMKSILEADPPYGAQVNSQVQVRRAGTRRC